MKNTSVTQEKKGAYPHNGTLLNDTTKLFTEKEKKSLHRHFTTMRIQLEGLIEDYIFEMQQNRALIRHFKVTNIELSRIVNKEIGKGTMSIFKINKNKKIIHCTYP